MKTVIERLTLLGFDIRRAMPQKPGGLVVRPIGRAKCDWCGKPHLYALEEVIQRTCRFSGRVWLEAAENHLGTFCNTCGIFSAEGLSDATGYLRNAITEEPSNILSVIELMEQEALPLAGLSDAQLSVRIRKLERQVSAMKLVLEARKGPYRG